ncbi:outer dynein arm docking complex 3 [Plasmopara halstedii]|uniref:Outer dynein arm docking complex 3 n=1 Tax=Plasmopara halstedii TaxID=4781 RepID=A0A0P1AMV7_PLAHL|nr:outer dynein arm docking complex 3 [Plasmopara halstedii]CEG42293.1 outer dynein arm docking complex 3 [Plasmopara halstedii]|eukprot:XP_024578662.1 outer dynein arm docking complex 3 [Plasmopara halstedii]
MDAPKSGTGLSIEEQIQLRRIFRLLAFDTPLRRLEHKLEKLPEKPQAIGKRCKPLDNNAKRDRYEKEKLKYLATLQDEENLGRELVSSKYRIDLKALTTIYKQLGYPLSGQEQSHLVEMIWQVNDKLDGAICFDEFVNSYVRSRNDRSGLEPSELFFLTSFLMIDKKCCGRIALDDAMGILYKKYGESVDREMELHFGKLLDNDVHSVEFVEFQNATLKRLGELIDEHAHFARPDKFCKKL